MKKTKDCWTDMNMVLLCLRMTPVDYKLLSHAELQNLKAIRNNLRVRIYNMDPEKQNILETTDLTKNTKRYFGQRERDLQNLHDDLNIIIQNQQTGTWKKAVVTGRLTKPESDNTESGSTIRRTDITSGKCLPTTRKKRKGKLFQQTIWEKDIIKKMHTNTCTICRLCTTLQKYQFWKSVTQIIQIH